MALYRIFTFCYQAMHGCINFYLLKAYRKATKIL